MKFNFKQKITKCKRIQIVIYDKRTAFLIKNKQYYAYSLKIKLKICFRK